VYCALCIVHCALCIVHCALCPLLVSTGNVHTFVCVCVCACARALPRVCHNRDRNLLARVVQMAVMVFGGHTQWRYRVREERWRLGRLALAILRDVLCDHSESLSGNPAATSTSAPTSSGYSSSSYSARAAGASGRRASSTAYAGWDGRRGGGASSTPEFVVHERDQLLSAFLRDQSLQSSLITAATLLASSAFEVGGDVGDVGGGDSVAGSKLLPVDFDAGLLGLIRSASERLQVEGLTRCALSVTCLVLMACDSSCAVSADGTAWNAAAKVALLTRHVGTSEYNRKFQRAGPVTRTSAFEGMATSSHLHPNRNVVVALAAMIGYPQVHASGCCVNIGIGLVWFGLVGVVWVVWVVWLVCALRPWRVSSCRVRVAACAVGSDGLLGLRQVVFCVFTLGVWCGCLLPVACCLLQDPVGPIPRLAVRALGLLARCMQASPPRPIHSTARQDSMLAYLAGDGGSLQRLLFPAQAGREAFPIPVRVAILELTITLMDTQPAMAGLLLNTRTTTSAASGGKSVRFDATGAGAGAGESKDESKTGGDSDKKKKKDDVVIGTLVLQRPSVLVEVLDVLEHAQTHMKHNPRLLSVAVHLLLGMFRDGA